MKEYKVKIGIEVKLVFVVFQVIIICLLVGVIKAIIDNNMADALICGLITIILVICSIFIIYPVMFKSKIELDDEKIFVKVGPFKETIYLKNITSIEKSNKFFQPYAYSLALSRHYIQIKHSTYGDTLVSAVDEDELLADMKRRIAIIKDNN